MAGPERSMGEKFVEFSKKLDVAMIAVGAGVYVLFNRSVGAAIVIGSVITLIPATAVGRWMKRKKG